MINEINDYLKLADQSERYCHHFLIELGARIFTNKGFGGHQYALKHCIRGMLELLIKKLDGEKPLFF